MPRQARQASGTGIYHVMMRGINHQNIFEEQEELDHMTNQEVAVWYNDNVIYPDKVDWTDEMLAD